MLPEVRSTPETRAIEVATPSPTGRTTIRENSTGTSGRHVFVHGRGRSGTEKGVWQITWRWLDKCFRTTSQLRKIKSEQTKIMRSKTTEPMMQWTRLRLRSRWQKGLIRLHGSRRCHNRSWASKLVTGLDCRCSMSAQRRIFSEMMMMMMLTFRSWKTFPPGFHVNREYPPALHRSPLGGMPSMITRLYPSQSILGRRRKLTTSKMASMETTKFSR